MIYLVPLLALLPGFAWLSFYLEEDPHPEPKRLVVLTFVSGAAWALVAFAAQIFLYRTHLALDPARVSEPSLYFLFSLVLLAFTEELAKFLAAYVAVRKNPAFTLPIDAMIYMVIAALGFATLENVGAIFPPSGQSLLLSTALETISVRFLGATLLHTFTSGLVGYYWATMIRDFQSKRFLVLGLLLAAVLHAIFNYLIITYSNLTYALLFIVMVGLFALADFEKLKHRSV